MKTPMPNLVRHLPLAALLINLCACEALTDDITPAVRPGDTFRLNQTIEFTTGKASLVMQHGRFIEETNIDYYAAYCQISLPTATTASEKIPPGNFVIKQVALSSEINPAEPTQTPRLGAKYSNYTTRLLLTSPTKFELHSITCQRLAERFGGYYLTLEEINEALGETAHIDILTKPTR